MSKDTFKIKLHKLIGDHYAETGERIQRLKVAPEWADSKDSPIVALSIGKGLKVKIEESNNRAIRIGSEKSTDIVETMEQLGDQLQKRLDEIEADDDTRNMCNSCKYWIEHGSRGFGTCELNPPALNISAIRSAVKPPDINDHPLWWDQPVTDCEMSCGQYVSNS